MSGKGKGERLSSYNFNLSKYDPYTNDPSNNQEILINETVLRYIATQYKNKERAMRVADPPAEQELPWPLNRDLDKLIIAYTSNISKLRMEGRKMKIFDQQIERGESPDNAAHLAQYDDMIYRRIQ